MIVKEAGDIFTCDCGFSWLRGNSGAHDCSYGYRKQIAELREKLANPVVLHNERDHYQDTDEYEQGYVRGWNASRREAVAGIEKSGFTVREE